MSSITLTLPTWMPLNAVYFMVAGSAGLLANFVNQRLKGQIDTPLYEYLFLRAPARTAASVLSLIAAAFAAVAIGGLEEMKLTTAVAAGFTSGWAIDAGVNRAPQSQQADP
jgi:hypothetical protein